MADFISGQDLVARGAEGTGAAVVLDNRPTIQSLARLGGRMDNLYKTQEMLKLKLAAAKQKEVKPEKPPTLNTFATNGIIGEALAGTGSELFEAVKNISRNEYNKQVSSNDNAGANQTAADAASALAAINSSVSRFDNAKKSFLEGSGDFFSITDQKVQNILRQIPSINQDELSRITDPVEQKKYIANKLDQFVKINPTKILADATILDPTTFNYGGVFNLIDKQIVDNDISVTSSDGTTRAKKASELFKITPATATKPGKVELDYNKAVGVINKFPKAAEQIQVLQKMKRTEVEGTDIYKNLSEKDKEKRLAEVDKEVANRYAYDVFKNGLTFDQKYDFETTKQRSQSTEEGAIKASEPPSAEGDMVFNVNRNLALERQKMVNGKGLTKVVNGKTFVDKEQYGTENFDYPVRVVGKTVVVDDFPLGNNQPFIFLNKEDPQNITDLKAREYKPLNAAKQSGIYVSGLGTKASKATKVLGGMPLFFNKVQDSRDPRIVHYPSDPVPEYMLTDMKDDGKGKQIPYLEKTDYILPTGVVAEPEITKAAEGIGPATTESTVQAFFFDKLSSQKVFDAVARGKRMRAEDAASTNFWKRSLNTPRK